MQVDRQRGDRRPRGQVQRDRVDRRELVARLHHRRGQRSSGLIVEVGPDDQQARHPDGAHRRHVRVGAHRDRGVDEVGPVPLRHRRQVFGQVDQPEVEPLGEFGDRRGGQAAGPEERLDPALFKGVRRLLQVELVPLHRCARPAAGDAGQGEQAVGDHLGA